MTRSRWPVSRLAAVVPVTLSLLGPDGAVRRTIYRATDENGQLNESLPTGAFETPGTYRLVARQQLDGRAVSLPITLKAAPRQSRARTARGGA